MAAASDCKKQERGRAEPGHRALDPSTPQPKPATHFESATGAIAKGSLSQAFATFCFGLTGLRVEEVLSRILRVLRHT